jgi:hypothetical protein
LKPSLSILGEILCLPSNSKGETLLLSANTEVGAILYFRLTCKNTKLLDEIKQLDEIQH